MKWKEGLKKWDLIVRCNWVLSSILDTSAFAPNVHACAIEFYPRNWKCLHLLPCTHTCPHKMPWIHLIQYHPALLRRLRNLYWNTSTSPLILDSRHWTEICFSSTAPILDKQLHDNIHACIHQNFHPSSHWTFVYQLNVDFQSLFFVCAGLKCLNVKCSSCTKIRRGFPPLPWFFFC